MAPPSPTLRRILLVAGWLCVGIGAAGIVLPLVPTTGPLLLAAFCFDRSSPRFHTWLTEHRWFGAYIRDYRAGRGLPALQKTCTIGLLWLSIGASMVFAVDAWWGRLLLSLIAVGVTWHILALPTARPGAAPETAP